jgi:hypothetical protein
VITRASIEPQVLGLPYLGANISGFNDVVFSVAGDVLGDSEAPVVTHKSQGFVGSIFKDAHRDRVCVVRS